MNKSKQQFGGNWTDEKLGRVSKYLRAYATIMNKQDFRFAYIDAFAGTGYRTLKREENQSELMFPELAEQEAQSFLEGSARIALRVKPRFTKYIFIEKDEKRFSSLIQLRDDFPELQNDIILVNADSNNYLQELCLNYPWKKNRAVLFLDPYGMQVEWETVAAIAKTPAIDLWLLFPLGVAINRLLRRDGKIEKSIKAKLDKFFGTTDWMNAFYKSETQTSLFGSERTIEKAVNLDGISNYFVRRLKTVFAGVADNALRLYDSRNNPLYLSCFASGHKKGAPTALKIANDILKK